MSAFEDRFGLPLSTRSEAAAQAYLVGVDHMLGLTHGAEEALHESLTHDPDFALAQIGLGRHLLIAGRGREARQAAVRARGLAATLGQRERRHVEIIALGIDGRSDPAYALLLEHLDDFPTDALPLSLALGVYGLISFSGILDHHEVQVALMERLAPHWPQHWWFLTYLGWSYVEVGQSERGNPLLDQALEIHPGNAQAAHGRAHGYYEQGEARAGAEFIARWLPGYDPASPLHCHVAWHQALFNLQLGDVEQAMAIYQRSVRPAAAQSVPMFTVIDCASFLWRCMLHGHPLPVAQRQEVAEFAREHFAGGGLPFLNLHAAFAYAAAGDAAALAELEAVVGKLEADGKVSPGPVVGRLCGAMVAYGRDDYAAAAALLAQAHPDFARVGGSHAQRDLLLQTFIDACLKSGEKERAIDLIEAEYGGRAQHLGRLWRGYAGR